MTHVDNNNNNKTQKGSNSHDVHVPHVLCGRVPRDLHHRAAEGGRVAERVVVAVAGEELGDGRRDGEAPHGNVFARAALQHEGQEGISAGHRHCQTQVVSFITINQVVKAHKEFWLALPSFIH